MNLLSFLSLSIYSQRYTNKTTSTSINQSINHKRRKAVTLNDELKRGHIYGTTILKSNYITSNEFRLKFLRCEFFDITKACIRYCKNLNLVYELFGDVALLRPLQINDLSKREIQHLKGKAYLYCTVKRKRKRNLAVAVAVAVSNTTYLFKNIIVLYMLLCIKITASHSFILCSFLMLNNIIKKKYIII